MVRIIAAFVGLGFAFVLLLSLGFGLSDYFTDRPKPTAEKEFRKEAKELKLASNGPLGKFDEQQLQRGYQVYKEVCAVCHSMNLVSYRNLAELGYNEAEIKAEAAQHEVPSINPDTGEPSTRKATPADRFPSPYANEIAARSANNNALPPDLSLITKAREGGPAYVYSLLTGYQAQPAELLKRFPEAKTPQGLYYNPYFANLNIAMARPLTSDGQVTYAPGNPKPTVDQMAKDVSAFLVWTAEPNLARRHGYGIAVVIFLIFATVLGYLSYRNIWAEAKRKVAPKGPLDPGNKVKRDRAKAKAKAGIAG